MRGDRRAVVLGASNVMRGLPELVTTLRRGSGGPLDLLMATGHGRSYGMGSRVLGRTLPGILECGLWGALGERPARPTVALVTDVGNDILYGAPPAVIVGWADETVRRLRAVTDRIVVAGLPLAGIRALGPARYLLVRKILFPRCRVSLAEARAAAEEVDRGLRSSASHHGATFVEPDPTWYGLDPIHVRRTARVRSWERLLAPLADAGARAATPSTLLDAIRLRRLRPERRWLFGREQQTPQPAGVLRDGTRVSLF